MLFKSILPASLLFASTFAAPAVIEARAGETQTFYPWLLVPIRQETPDKAFGTQYTVDISYDKAKANRVDTLVSFFNSVPAAKNQKCALQFNLAKSATWSWAISGSLKFEIVELGGREVQQTDTYNNAPAYGKTIATVSVDITGGPGTITYTVPLACRQNRIDYALRKSGSDNVNFHWFEMKDPTNGLTYVVSQ